MTTNDEITTTEAASLMGVSKKTIYRLLESGDIEASKPFGNRVGHRISRAVLENWYRRRKISTTNRRAK
jgi:excisionase family DNA binding protein